jgi:hypothetical protein
LLSITDDVPRRSPIDDYREPQRSRGGLLTTRPAALHLRREHCVNTPNSMPFHVTLAL